MPEFATRLERSTVLVKHSGYIVRHPIFNDTLHHSVLEENKEDFVTLLRKILYCLRCSINLRGVVVYISFCQKVSVRQLALMTNVTVATYIYFPPLPPFHSTSLQFILLRTTLIQSPVAEARRSTLLVNSYPAYGERQHENDLELLSSRCPCTCICTTRFQNRAQHASSLPRLSLLFSFGYLSCRRQMQSLETDGLWRGFINQYSSARRTC